MTTWTSGRGRLHRLVPCTKGSSSSTAMHTDRAQRSGAFACNVEQISTFAERRVREEDFVACEGLKRQKQHVRIGRYKLLKPAWSAHEVVALNKVQHLRILSEFSCGKPDPQMATDELTVLPTADCVCTQCPRTAERRRMAAKAAHPHPMCATVVPRVVEWSGPACDIAQPPQVSKRNVCATPCYGAERARLRHLDAVAASLAPSVRQPWPALPLLQPIRKLGMPDGPADQRVCRARCVRVTAAALQLRCAGRERVAVSAGDDVDTRSHHSPEELVGAVRPQIRDQGRRPFPRYVQLREELEACALDWIQ